MGEGNEITINVSRQVAEVLDELVDGGYYGETRAATVEELLSAQIRQMLKDGTLAVSTRK